MYAKLKSGGQLQTAPNPLRIVISNPTDERLEYEGYHKVINTDPPEHDHDTQYLTDRWEQDGQYVVQHWYVHEIPDKEV